MENLARSSSHISPPNMSIALLLEGRWFLIVVLHLSQLCHDLNRIRLSSYFLDLWVLLVVS
jgi:hypothetical protein